MKIVNIYLVVYALLAAISISVITLIILMALKMKKHKNVGTALKIGTVAGIVLGCIVTIWLCSHKSYPLINDWAFLGKDINDIEHKYKTFEQYVTREDGSGYAVLMTEKITGKDMYDLGDYSCYNMEFDKNGKIVKVYCSRPIGG